MGEGEGLRVYHMGEGRVSEEDQKTTQRRKEEGKGGCGKREGEEERGRDWAKGLLIRSISKEGPISNIKDKSNRS